MDLPFRRRRYSMKEGKTVDLERAKKNKGELI
jgi:hypothetical protein